MLYLTIDNYTSEIAELHADVARCQTHVGKYTLLFKAVEVNERMIAAIEEDWVNLKDGEWRAILGRDEGMHRKKIYLIIGLVWGTYTQRLVKRDGKISMVDMDWNSKSSPVQLTFEQTAAINRL